MNGRDTRRRSRAAAAAYLVQGLESRKLLSSTIYVDASSPAQVPDGESWRTAYADLQQALAKATYGDQIRIAQGTYRPAAGSDRSSCFNLRDGVELLGGFAGFSSSHPDVRNPGATPAVLSGDIGITGDRSDNSYHVLTATGVSSATLLDGVTITLGNASGAAGLDACGGGLLAISSFLRLANCTFIGNSASGSGGGMCNFYSFSPSITNCVFSGNVGGSGGGMYNAYASPTLVNCTFSGNRADCGGGMYNASSSPTISNCILWSSGEFFYNSDAGSNPILTRCDIPGGYAGSDNLDSDPLFFRSPGPGLDQTWGTADDDYGELHLQPGSGCIDKGTNAAIPAGTTTDRDGSPRISDGIVDIGAFEVQFLAPDPNCDITLASGSAILPSQATLASLSVLNSARLFLCAGHDKPLVVSSLFVAPAARIDLGDNDLVLVYSGDSPEATMQQLANRSVIASSAEDAGFSQSLRTLAVFDNHDAHFTWIDGVTLTGLNQVIVKYTYLGDANADGKVDPTDYAVVDGKIGLGDSWITGDLNFDGKADPSDYAQIDGNQGAGQGGAGGPRLSGFGFARTPPAAEPKEAAIASTAASWAPVPAAAVCPFSTTPLPHRDDLLLVLA